MRPHDQGGRPSRADAAPDALDRGRAVASAVLAAIFTCHAYTRAAAPADRGTALQCCAAPTGLAALRGHATSAPCAPTRSWARSARHACSTPCHAAARAVDRRGG